MRFAIALSVLLAAGCASLKPDAQDAAAVSEIVSMAVETLRSTPEVQRERLSVSLGALTSQPDDAARLRAAVLLATLPPPLRDGVRASSLMKPLAARAPETAFSHFAWLFQARLLEREQESEDLREQLRAAEKQAATLRAEVDALRANERVLAEREDTVRRQVEALRDSERTMAEREETIRKQIEALRESERIMNEREGRLGSKTR